MKLLLPSAVLLLFSAGPRDEIALRFEPEEGTVLKRVFVAEAEYRLADVTESINGEAAEREGELPDYRSSFTEHIAVTDTLKAVADGRPADLVRTFDELRQDSTFQIGDQEAEQSLKSDLQARTVRFHWEADEERYEVEAADEEDLDASVAEWLLEDMDLRLVLPDGEVEPGDEWELDPKLYLAFMWPGGWLDFHDSEQEADESDDGGRASSLQTIERLEGSGTARLEEVREEDGLRLAVIHVELDLTTGSESVQPATGEGEEARPEITLEIEIERTLSGTILWDLDHGHAHSAELECEASRLETESCDVPVAEGETVALEQVRLFEGTIRYTATIERE